MSDKLKFGDLPVGAKFISFPVPGDDSGHGGYRQGSYLFKKVDTDVPGYANPTGRALRAKDGVPCTMHHSMPVLLVLD